MENNLTLRQQILLAFIGSDSSGRLDPIRIMKGMFVLAMETPREWLPEEAFYNFDPYYYGPYAPEIYTDLYQLENEGYIYSVQNPGHSWKYYSVTPEGAQLAETIKSSLDHRVVRYIAQISRFVTSLSFRQLLASIYKKYPDYAVNSVFQF